VTKNVRIPLTGSGLTTKLPLPDQSNDVPAGVPSLTNRKGCIDGNRGFAAMNRCSPATASSAVYEPLLGSSGPRSTAAVVPWLVPSERYRTGT
jgi:hypothetical protein